MPSTIIVLCGVAACFILVHQMRVPVLPRAERSAAEHPVLLLLLPFFPWICLATAIAFTNPRSGSGPWLADFLDAVVEFAWMPALLLAVFSVRAYRTWKRDRADASRGQASSGAP